MDQILLVDGDERFSKEMSERLVARGYRVTRAGSAFKGLQMVREGRTGLVLTEARLPDGDGLPLLEAAGSSEGLTRVVVLSKRFSPELVLSSMSRGAYDCIPKPLDDTTLDDLLTRVHVSGVAAVSHFVDRSQNPPSREDEMVIGRSPGMIEALKSAGAASVSDATVLIVGESGTGKELLAKAIHRASGRSGRLVAVNCAAIVETLTEAELFGHERGAFTGATERRLGCFERARGGTLFLDEIGDSSRSFQAKLLRVLDRSEFYRVGGQSPIKSDVRVISATNCDLNDLVSGETFREDLYYRLSEVIIPLPALRERRLDLPLLLGRIVSKINRRLNRKISGVSREAMDRLTIYAWPGNVREMQNVITRAAMHCRGQIIEASDLGVLDHHPHTQDENRVRTLVELECDHIAQVLDITGWNRGEACRMLGITRPTLRRKIRVYGLSKSG